MRNLVTSRPNRMYKDRLLCMIFSDKSALLSLYNAMNKTNYINPKELPDMIELKLSEAFGQKEKQPNLELKTILLNINQGHNKYLMEHCKTLHDQAMYYHHKTICSSSCCRQ